MHVVILLPKEEYNTQHASKINNKQFAGHKTASEEAASLPDSLRETAREGWQGCGNDPSAGSPTETLLRLHLPLNDEV